MTYRLSFVFSPTLTSSHGFSRPMRPPLDSVRGRRGCCVSGKLESGSMMLEQLALARRSDAKGPRFMRFRFESVYYFLSARRLGLLDRVQHCQRSCY